MSKTRDDEWFTEDQARWWADQKRDEEELQQIEHEKLREELMDEVVREFKEDYWPKIAERLTDEAVAHGRFAYRQGFIRGFAAALMGAVAFYLLT